MPIKPKTEKRRQEIIAAAAAHLVQHGFRNSGLRAIAESAGMSDRMVMYYFETKDELVSEALVMLAQGLSASLENTLPYRTASGEKIVSALVDSALAEESRPVLELWFEIVGLAVRGDEPYKKIAELFLDEWERWIADKLKPAQRHRAADLLAQVEGSVMIKLLRN